MVSQRGFPKERSRGESIMTGCLISRLMVHEKHLVVTMGDLMVDQLMVLKSEEPFHLDQ